jgi:hypothetical protein
VLKGGPLPEPECVVCAALAAAGGCASFGDEIRSYHEGSVWDVAEWSGLDVLQVTEAATSSDVARQVYEAMRGAIQAERCAVLCLLAGWQPPKVRLPRDWRSAGMG